jgi:hypothetical protein
VAKTADEIRAWVQQNLVEGLADKSGSVLYSGIDTLRPGPFYLMGLNPGGAPAEGTSSIASSIHERRAWSAYTQDCWITGCDEQAPCSHIARGQRAPHQERVRTLVAALGVEPETIFATNAIFARSKDEASLKSQVEGMGSWDWWGRCWPVHQQFLREIRPRWIITLGKGYGTSAFSFLMHVAKVKRARVRAFGDDSERDGRWFVADLPLDDGTMLPVRVLGMPHPSYYEISPHLAESLKAQAAGLLSGMVPSDDPHWTPAAATPAEEPLATRRNYLLRFADGFHGLGAWEPSISHAGWDWSPSLFGLDEEGRPAQATSSGIVNGPAHWRPVPDNWKALMDAAWGRGGYN